MTDFPRRPLSQSALSAYFAKLTLREWRAVAIFWAWAAAVFAAAWLIAIALAFGIMTIVAGLLK